MTNKLFLTKDLQVNNNAHILYIFEDNQCYLENLIAYIHAGIERNHHLIVIEEAALFPEIKKRLQHDNGQKYVHLIDNQQFYRSYGDFHIHHIVEHFYDILKPFLEKDINIRTWAHVNWKEQNDIVNKLDEFECLADKSVNHMRLMSVCAYNAYDVSANLQTILMRSHEYLMTDQELVPSSLYSLGRKNER
ncbi:MEDS: MEthanogen/methylotroph, DcmR Sensory domain [Salinibacillus kushneri]|uniref:MEDS: MEthanogen/methylotroph, DcmR Sensory domain n=1 Tax=Salinibacillus kushneri TaxID=237682 RepID=A0A1I0ADS3_9BACI|nr:MEDS domain-containing protein [Salinibacillus kushneri]SES91920.1 MEDS: MEthanogen/methylotroph, DcmR Sensory domain [Salinibacillus kushneri]